MNPVTVNKKSQAIVYDADVLPSVDAGIFDPAHWQARGSLFGSASGRGTTHFIEAPFGQAVLRRYLRGGWAARITSDRYLFTGVERSRPFREFHLLRSMHSSGLPVPQPLAALCDRSGWSYGGALITRRIAPARALPECFTDSGLDWAGLGTGLRAFHDAGVSHADLNARNILVQEDTGRVWLLDFDRSSFEPGRKVDGRANLARLKRSLEKLWPADAPEFEPCWNALVEGYRG